MKVSSQNKTTEILWVALTRICQRKIRHTGYFYAVQEIGYPVHSRLILIRRGPKGEHHSCWLRFLSLHKLSLSSDKSSAPPSNLQPSYKEGRSLLYRLPGLSLKSFVNWLCDGGLHQIHISNHQRSIKILKVFVELSIAQVICAKQKQKDISVFFSALKKRSEWWKTEYMCEYRNSQSKRRKSLSSWKSGKLSQLSGDWISRAASMSMA